MRGLMNSPAADIPTKGPLHDVKERIKCAIINPGRGVATSPRAPHPLSRCRVSKGAPRASAAGTHPPVWPAPSTMPIAMPTNKATAIANL